MEMSPGFCIAHYRVGSKLGAGGMGEVWRATDTRLGRDVAIKILPEVFAQDADRMTRLQREAQVLASLNHPNIAAIYAIEDRALVLELVEGPTLAELIAARPLPFERALAIARQIAAALECAHERGIVHRDLKPANIKIQPDGRCKVLDFGLAKSARTTMVQSADSTQALTVTELGAVIGTPAYMAPEQARANPVDKRADIWAFGVVFFEMLTGQRLFEGASTTDILAAVLTHEPDWNAVPVPVRPLLKQCLQRDPRARLRDIGDIELLLKEGAPATASPRSHLRKRLLVAALWAASIVLATMLWPRNETAPRSLIQFSADLGPDAVENSGKGMEMALSENGARLAYLVWNGGVRQIATRGLDQAATTVVPGTEGASGVFLSPDGQWVGFYADGKIKKTPTQGGPVIDLCDAPNSRGAWWGRDGFIAANLTLGGGLFRLPDTGGSPERLTDPASTDEATHRWPQVLPGGDAVLFTGHKITMNYDQANLEIFSRRSGKWKVIQKGGYFGRYVPTGHLLYVSQSTLYAAPFDLARLEVRGVPVPLLEDVAGSNGNGAGRYAAHNGTLVYFSTRSAPHSGPVSWLDDTGGLEKIPVEAGQYLSPRISPDGGRLAISVKQDRSAADIFVCDLQRNSSTRLTFGQDNTEPLWTPDGKHIVYESVSRDSIALRWKRGWGGRDANSLRDQERNATQLVLSRRPVTSVHGVGYELYVSSLDHVPRIERSG